MTTPKKTAPSAGRETKPHIGIFGRCNSGKSTVLNLITATDTAVTSPVAGTTTDVVRKSYEITGLGPVIFIDTPGLGDTSTLGPQRLRRTEETVRQVDMAILIFRSWGEEETRFAEKLRMQSVPWIAVQNLWGGSECEPGQPLRSFAEADLDISTENHPGIGPAVVLNPAEDEEVFRGRLLKAVEGALGPDAFRAPSMFEGMVSEGDTVLLVCPIDSGAPAGRLILPQVQAIRELLDRHAIPIAVQPREIENIYAGGIRPALVVTDSQVFPEVKASLPEDAELTSFSILLAASKGDYQLYLKGLETVDRLRDGDRVLITENCAHHSTCDDIGRVKIPRWLSEYTGAKLDFTFVSGLSPLPDDLGEYALMVQCGGCMVTRSQLRNRIRQAASARVPVTNYGMLIRKIRK